MVVLFPTILLLILPADVRGCVCDPARSETMESTACSLSRIAFRQPEQPATFFLHDSNPTKPNRWLALPHANRRSLNDMTEPERKVFWTAAVDKARSLWGDDWGIAINAEERRSQCQMHAHIGKLLPDTDRTGGDVVLRVEDISVPAPDEGMWIHAEGPGFRVHNGPKASELFLQR